MNLCLRRRRPRRQRRPSVPQPRPRTPALSVWFSWSLISAGIVGISGGKEPDHLRFDFGCALGQNTAFASPAQLTLQPPTSSLTSPVQHEPSVLVSLALSLLLVVHADSGSLCSSDHSPCPRSRPYVSCLSAFRRTHQAPVLTLVLRPCRFEESLLSSATVRVSLPVRSAPRTAYSDNCFLHHFNVGMLSN